MESKDSKQSIRISGDSVDKQKYEHIRHLREEETVNQEPVSLTNALISVVKNNTVFVSPNVYHTKFNSLMGCVIGIEGNIGVGKSTMCRKLNEYLLKRNVGVEITYETEDLTMLKLFYGDPKTYAYALQRMMLGERKHIHMRSEDLAGKLLRPRSCPKTGKRVVFSDRTLWGDVVFAAISASCGNMTAEQFQSYKAQIEEGGPYEYDAVLFLDANAETSYENAQNRGRKEEASVSMEYLRLLRRAYYVVMKARTTIGDSKIIVIKNKPFVNAEYILECLICNYNQDIIRNIWTCSPNINDLSTDKEVDEAYDYINASYETLLPKRT